MSFNQSSEERFLRFLTYRGVGVKEAARREGSTNSGSQRSRNMPLRRINFNHDDDGTISESSEVETEVSEREIPTVTEFFYAAEAESDEESQDTDDVDYFRFIREEDDMDADIFYTFRRESFGSAEDRDMDSELNSDQEEQTDKNIEYVSLGLRRQRRYTNNTGERMPPEGFQKEEFTGKFPMDSLEAYEKWEFKDNVDLTDSSNDRLEGSGRLHTQNVHEPKKSDILNWPKLMDFEDGTIVDKLRFLKLSDVERVRKYKNNISVIISDVDGKEYLVTATNSKLVVFGFNELTNLPEQIACLLFDTKPAFSSTTDRLVSTWPYFPHTINYLKVYNNFLGKQVLGACIDDGNLLMWYSESILKYVKKYDHTSLESNEIRFAGTKIKPDFQVKFEASLWGLDFKTYKDPTGYEHNLIVCSDNSQSIVLLYYHPGDGCFYHVKTHQLLQNIPEVSFFDIGFSNSSHIVKVTCASISGELVVFRFKFRLVLGPLNEIEISTESNRIYYVDPEIERLETTEAHRGSVRQRILHRINFLTPVVISRTLLGEDCWTTKPISSKYFKPVLSLRNMIGDDHINEKEETEYIMTESKLLDLTFDPMKTSDLGLAARWQYFRTPVINLLTDQSKNKEILYEHFKLTTLDDDYRRINKAVLKMFKKYDDRKHLSMNSKHYKLLSEEEQDLTFFLVSTSRRVGIFNSDTLFCNSSTKSLFNLDDPLTDEIYSNRISITAVIPELLVFICVTQQGVFSIMRLCQYRGVYGMRQEHVLPNSSNLDIGYHGARCITGLAIRNVSLSETFPRFLIYVTYTDGLVLSYELTSTSSKYLNYNSIFS